MKRKSTKARRLRLAVMATLLAGCFSIAPAAQALPVGGSSSTAAIAVNDKVMNITSATESNLITWRDFSIGQGEKVAFDTHSYLNYVTGSGISNILGELSGKGHVYLVNPNGIQIGDGAKIDVGTLQLATADLSGNLTDFRTAFMALMNAANTLTGDIVNKGRLNVAQNIIVQGKNITFKNVDDVTTGAAWDEAGNLTEAGTRNTQVNLRSRGGEIHLGSMDGTGTYTGTSGTTYRYKLVSTPAELQAIKDGLAGNYMLNNDIEVGTISPLGEFTGKFDGLGYALNNMTINSAADNVGLLTDKIKI
ncbi:hypothetical protein SELR_02710 [Selenomonas ruminantium subsp. lactilytica TAM6421]|uniref:Filamentous haemagglutinin FhaB/tRNA nuclease CdiA-like TPS domain-containing protein n=1 Tax=Selenomonas ruminantium subsp. lactilytica (strain NBRC 103574 / TAM6421) TaxID=927704 RepID=I0GMJ2_SELRL|nr:filamentous hemagglutinin N-terminal domain-containing protein [Selenomonas ruminantium]BAL81979.1 hypothetical protein SELR_02710 [Selenomonas ruminantium subsp. lactilytica TAM6421]